MRKETLKDIGGYHEEKEEFSKVIRFFQNYDEFVSNGAKLPSGILIYGESGTGKTMFANAIANESKVPVFRIKKDASTNVLKCYSLFDKAIQRAPSIVIIDEIDQLIKCEGYISDIASSDKENAFLRCLLTKIDEAAGNNVLTIATASASLYDIPSAVKRSGRLEKHIKLEVPSKEDRKEILEILLRSNPAFDQIDSEELCGITSGLKGADLKAIVNDSLCLALSLDRDKVEMTDFYKVIKAFIRSGKEDKVLHHLNDSYIYHEIGHFIVNYVLNNEINTISVESLTRGHHVNDDDPDAFLTEYTDRNRLEDCDCLTYKDYYNYSAVKVAGLAATEVYFGEKTDCAGNDLVDVFKAYNNIVNAGLIDDTYLLSYKLIASNSDFSFIDFPCLYTTAFNNYFKKVYQKAKEILETNKVLAEELFRRLKTKKTLSVKEITMILNQIKNK